MLLKTVENAIKRMTIPQRDPVKQDQKKRQSRQKFDRSSVASGGHGSHKELATAQDELTAELGPQAPNLNGLLGHPEDKLVPTDRAAKRESGPKPWLQRANSAHIPALRQADKVLDSDRKKIGRHSISMGPSDLARCVSRERRGFLG